MSQPIVFVGLPAYNEEIAIDRLLAKYEDLYRQGTRDLHIVVYNDGSRDKTVAIAESWKDRLPLDVIGTKENRGLGAGLKALVDYAISHGASDDILVLMDCDDTHDPAQIPSMIDLVKAGSDIVIASRFTKGATIVGVPALRRVTARGAMVLLKTLHHIPGVLDYTCGYRAYKIGFLQKADKAFPGGLVTQRGFACMVELLVKLRTLRPKVREVPLKLRYDLKPTASKMDVGSNVVSILRLMVKWRVKGFE